MFMRHPSYLGEDSGSQAIAGESSRILKQSWNNPKIVSQTVSRRLSHFPNSLLLKQQELEARVGIERCLQWPQPQYPDLQSHSDIDYKRLQVVFYTTPQLPALTCHAPVTHTTVEGFVECFCCNLF